MLKLRPLFRLVLKYEVGNGHKIFLWHGTWHPKGPLLPTYGPRILFGTCLPMDAKLGLPMDAKLDTVIHDIQWKWLAARTDEQLEL